MRLLSHTDTTDITDIAGEALNDKWFKFRLLTKTVKTLFCCWWVIPIRTAGSHRRLPFMHHRIQVHLSSLPHELKTAYGYNNRKDKPKKQSIYHGVSVIQNSLYPYRFFSDSGVFPFSDCIPKGWWCAYMLGLRACSQAKACRHTIIDVVLIRIKVFSRFSLILSALSTKLQKNLFIW